MQSKRLGSNKPRVFFSKLPFCLSQSTYLFTKPCKAICPICFLWGSVFGGPRKTYYQTPSEKDQKGHSKYVGFSFFLKEPLFASLNRRYVCLRSFPSAFCQLHPQPIPYKRYCWFCFRTKRKTEKQHEGTGDKY